jgi:hypothetical protein
LADRVSDLEEQLDDLPDPIPERGGIPWVTGTVYVTGDVVGNSAVAYICDTSHTAATINEPGTGGDWTDFWNALLTSAGDVSGPASSQTNNVAFFGDNTGDLLTNDLGANPGTAPTALLGTITNTTARPLTVSQTWNNAGLTGQLFILNATSTSSAAASTLQEWQLGGSNRGKFLKTGELRLLDGSAAAPVFAFDGASGTGMYRITGTGYLAFAAAGTLALHVGSGEVHVEQPLTASVSGVDKFYVTGTYVQSTVPFYPFTDDSTDLGRPPGGPGGLRWKNLCLSGFLSQGSAAPTIASAGSPAGTITPTTPVAFVSGTSAIDTITAPTPIATGGGSIKLIPTGIFTWTNAGNIAIAGTAVVSRVLEMTYDPGTSKWYPSYLA